MKKIKIDIDKELFFELLKSHSKLAQAEYNRNGSYNSSHYSHIAEEKIIKYLEKKNLFKEYLKYSENII